MTENSDSNNSTSTSPPNIVKTSVHNEHPIENRHKKLNRIHKYESYFKRTEINEEDLGKKYTIQTAKPPSVLYGTKRYITKRYKPSLICLKNYSLKRFPLFDWIRKYDIKENFLKDLIAGLTIGIIQIPQGMAYSLMAGLPPIIGLYVTFFTVLIYALLGTSRHLSLGIYAIVSLMVKATTDELEGHLYPSHSEINHGLNESHSHYISHDPIEARIMIGTALAFYTGIIQIFFAIFHVGFVTKYLSDVIVAAFTTGAAYHIVVSQLPLLLGLKVKPPEIPTKIIGDLIELFSLIEYTNIATLVISLISMIFIYCVKHFINEKFKEKMPVPIPVDLIVIITGTVVSYFVKFKDRWRVAIVGDIPLGLPTPKVPPLHLFSTLIGSSISIAIVSYAINFSMAKLFAKKYKYTLGSNQEAFAYGFGNVISSFFKGFPSCVGLSRSVILDSVGGRTQIYAIISTVLVIIVIEAIGPLFKTLPTCCLAAIIVVALIHLCLEVRQIYQIVKRSKFEALAWLVTFLGVIILDVDIGLYIGLGFSLLLIIVQSQRALTSVLGNIPYTDIYESIDICEDAKEFDGIKIIRYESSIYYANVEYFNYKILKLSELNVDDTLDKIKKARAEFENFMKQSNSSNDENFFLKLFRKSKQKDTDNDNNNHVSHGAKDGERKSSNVSQNSVKPALITNINQLELIIDTIKASLPIKHIIIDFSCVNIIDSMGVSALVNLNETFKEIGVDLHLTYCKRCVFRTFKKNLFKEKFDYENIYPTTHDAVLSILRKNKTQNIRLVSKRNQSIHINIMETEGEGSLHHDKSEGKFHPKYKARRQSNVFDEITSMNVEPVIAEENEEKHVVDTEAEVSLHHNKSEGKLHPKYKTRRKSNVFDEITSMHVEPVIIEEENEEMHTVKFDLP